MDDLDFEIVCQLPWHGLQIHYRMYARTSSGHYLHQLIMGVDGSSEVDHINRNGLDNRRENLRIVSHSKNIANAGMFSHNTSGYRGVVKFRRGWHAQFKFRQKNIWSRQMNSPEEAALLRDEIARQLHGGEIFLNFPDLTVSNVVKLEATRLIRLRGFEPMIA